jgi:hypothetical protein
MEERKGCEWKCPASKDVNMEVEGSTALESLAIQRLVKTKQTEKT